MPNSPLIPTLRFPGFEGEWEEKKLGDICSYKNGGSFENYVVENGKYNLITLNSIDINGKIKGKHKKVLSADWYLRKNDLIMVLSDVAHGYFLGLVDIIPENDKYVLNQRMGLLRIKSEDVDLVFLRTYINNKQHYFGLHGQGSSQQNLSKGDVLRFSVLAPRLLEQQKIASFLEKTDSWIENLKQQKQELEKYKKGMMHKIFAQEIRFKDENGNNFPEWEEKKLEQVIEIESGFPFSSKGFNEQGAGLPLIRIRDLKAKNLKTYYYGQYDSRFLVKNGDILIGMDGEFNLVNWTLGQALLNQRIMRIKARKNNDLAFISKIIAQKLKKIEEITPQTTVKHLSNKDINNIKSSIPYYIEQQKIADFLTSIDKVIQSKQLQISQALEWKKGLMQGLFV